MKDLFPHIQIYTGTAEGDGKTDITTGEANVRSGNTRRAGMVDTEGSTNTTPTEVLVEIGEHDGGQVSEKDVSVLEKDQ